MAWTQCVSRVFASSNVMRLRNTILSLILVCLVAGPTTSQTSDTSEPQNQTEPRSDAQEYGFAAWYNPYTGTFGRGAAVYGPYGGAGGFAAYNPRTGTYARGGAVYGPYGSRGFAQAWNPRTGTYAAPPGAARCTRGVFVAVVFAVAFDVIDPGSK